MFPIIDENKTYPTIDEYIKTIDILKYDYFGEFEHQG